MARIIFSTQNNTLVTHNGIFRNEIQKKQEGIKTCGIFVEKDFLLDALKAAL